MLTVNSKLKIIYSGRKRPKFLIPDIGSSSDSDSSSDQGNRKSDSESSGTSPPRKQKYKIPKNSTKGRKSKDTIKKLREDLPNLNHHSDEIFQSLSWSELFKLDNKLESHGKGGKN